MKAVIEIKGKVEPGCLIHLFFNKDLYRPMNDLLVIDLERVKEQGYDALVKIDIDGQIHVDEWFWPRPLGTKVQVYTEYPWHGKHIESSVELEVYSRHNILSATFLVLARTHIKLKREFPFIELDHRYPTFKFNKTHCFGS